jgi:methyl-accepting chemotaxis protein
VVTERRERAGAIAAESEEMRASIAEISRNAHQAAATAADATRAAKAANDTVAKLAESGSAVGGVIQMIDRIAAQTRLLALNATIEAARVGEAGRGFAVVAGEVKQLAQETAGATAEVKRRIEGIQAQAGDAVGAIGMILGIVGEINQTQAAIASAVEQQTATTAELSRHLTEAVT